MGGVFLRGAFVAQEVEIAAAFAAGIFAADGGAGFIDGATPGLGVEEAANAAIMLIRLAPHGIGLVAVHFGKFLPRVFEAEAEMLGQPGHIFLDERDDGIGTAVTRTLRAIIAH